MGTPITSLETLRELSEDNPLDIFLVLNGDVKSSKTITYYPNEEVYEIHNNIDDSDQVCSEKDLNKETNIIIALERGALYHY